MKYYIIAGEASGDLHASGLVREIRTLDPDAHFSGWGGDLMEKEGVSLARHYREVSFMGFAEVVTHLRTIYKAMKQCQADIVDYRPDAVILVDYPGFNLRIAAFCHRKKIRVVYYISPQVWAWNQSRVSQIKRNVDQMLVILPFEEEFYARFDFPVTFVGHPLLEITGTKSEFASREEFAEKNRLTGRPIVALLPGSRRQEITRMLPLMARAAKSFADYEFVVAAAPSQAPDLYAKILGDQSINVLTGQTYDLLRFSDAALVTSGTATLEAALIGVPEVVCYKGSPLSYAIAKRLVKVPYISLVNLVMQREVVKELIQGEFNEAQLKTELEKILDKEKAFRMKKDFEQLRRLLGEAGASRRAAQAIVGMNKSC